EKKIIVIDPGHGGKDPGAIANGLREKDVNLKIAKKLKQILQKDPRFEVYLTRERDRFVRLYDRTVFAVKKKADLFISIHCNSSLSRSESGTYIYTLNLRGARSKLARLVEQRENKAVIDYVRVSTNPLVNRIVADLAISTTMTEGRNFAMYLKKYLKDVTDFRDIDSANFAVLKTPGIPSVLIEVLYLTDPYDARLLKSEKFIESFSYSVYNAIVDYFYQE
ncbi:MAG: N-acetylmuramoyl-L-alanine amidase, partial [Aquificae bacterium]|nr:N-acetylmuramoyl-L-alanine amidase [Aquificota bacterium]